MQAEGIRGEENSAPFSVSDVSIAADTPAATDIQVWQGQYYTGTTFNAGTYNFNFTVYDASTGGNTCYSNTTTLTTGNFGEWKTEQIGVGGACNNVTKNYFLNINIDKVDQTPRRRLVVWNFLRKDVDEISNASIEINILKVRSGLKDLNKEISQSKLNYARELANTTLIAQQDVALKLITTTTTTSGESVESKIIKLQQAGEQAKKMISSELDIARAKISEAKKLALLNGETQADLAEIEAEANLHLIALNLTAQQQLIIIEQELNKSITNITASDDGIRYCLSNGTNCQTTPNLTNYALKNRSETFAGNITTTQTGFFGWLGSLTSRITVLFVQDINVNRSINASGNITATYFLGDGSQLTNLPSSNATSKNYTHLSNFTNDLGFLNLTQAQAYNDTVLITSINTTLENNKVPYTGATNNLNLGNFNVTANSGFFSYLGSLFNRITTLFVQDIDVSNNIKAKTAGISTNATLESLIFKRHDAFGMAILLNKTNEAIRLFAAPNITNPSNGAGLQLFGNTAGFFPGDVYIDAGSVSGGQIIMRTGASGLNDRVIVEGDGRVKVLNLTGSGNDYVCVDANGYLFRSNTAC